VPPITTGQIVAFYLFDVAESIDLAAIAALVGSSAVAARLAPKPATPAYVQYENPPVSFDGAAVDAPTLDGFQVRFRTYDYGVISLALSSAVSGPWSELLSIGQALIENAELEQHAEEVCRRVMTRLRPALTDPRAIVLGETTSSTSSTSWSVRCRQRICRDARRHHRADAARRAAGA
jgi:hypothetical protein